MLWLGRAQKGREPLEGVKVNLIENVVGIQT